MPKLNVSDFTKSGVIVLLGTLSVRCVVDGTSRAPLSRALGLHATLKTVADVCRVSPETVEDFRTAARAVLTACWLPSGPHGLPHSPSCSVLHASDLRGLCFLFDLSWFSHLSESPQVLSPQCGPLPVPAQRRHGPEPAPCDTARFPSNAP